MSDLTVARPGGVELHVELHGEARRDAMVLLLTHGYGASTAMWEPNLAALGAQRRVVTWDVRGHGRTRTPSDPALYSEAHSVADMVAVLDHLGVERAAVGGLSLGGYLSLALHLAAPERVGALVLADTGPGYRDGDARERWNAFARRQAEGFEQRGLEALGTGPELRAGTHDPEGLALAGRGILVQRDARVIDSLPQVSVPTLVLVGGDDAPFLDASRYMAARIPGARLVVLEGAGHAANIDAPEAFDDAVAGFLRSIPPAP